MARTWLLIICATGAACTSTTTPTETAPPAPAANRPPVIANVTATPGFGIQDRTSFTFAVAATDADNDALTYSWDFGGASSTGATVSRTFATGGANFVTVTVSDGRGGAVTGTPPLIVGTLTGRWRGMDSLFGPLDVTLTQTQGKMTGTFATEDFSAPILPFSQTVDNTIEADGMFRMSCDVPLVDLSTGREFASRVRFWGTLDSTGRRMTGTLSSNDFQLTNYTLDKQ